MLIVSLVHSSSHPLIPLKHNCQSYIFVSVCTTIGIGPENRDIAAAITVRSSGDCIQTSLQKICWLMRELLCSYGNIESVWWDTNEASLKGTQLSHQGWMQNKVSNGFGTTVCHENRLVKMIPTTPNKLCVISKSVFLKCGLSLILVYPNPQ